MTNVQNFSRKQQAQTAQAKITKYNPEQYQSYCIGMHYYTIRYDTIRYIICTEKLTGKLPV